MNCHEGPIWPGAWVFLLSPLAIPWSLRLRTYTSGFGSPLDARVGHPKAVNVANLSLNLGVDSPFF